MRLGIVSHAAPRFASGGDVHAFEVIKGLARVAEGFDITFSPDTEIFFM